MFDHRRIRIDKGLYARLNSSRSKLGFRSVDEYAIHILERELERTDDGQEETQDRLRGLGYLD